MDVPESNPSIPAERPSWSARHSIKNRARDGLVSILAVFVVVATHFVYPVAVMQFTAGLSLTLVGIGLFLGLLIGIFVIPIVGTTFAIEIANVTSRGQPKTGWGWPGYFAIPSVIAFWIYVISFNWIESILQNLHLIHSFPEEGLNLGGWLILASTVLLLGTEFKMGLYGLQDDLKSRNDVAGSDKNGETISSKSRVEDTKSLEAYDTEEYVFSWQNHPKIGFSDVGGMHEVKDNIFRLIINPRINPSSAYERFRVSPPTGILLYGPPGTGKTHLARAIAGELGSPYVELSQADLTSMWINESPAKIRTLFEEAESFDSSVIFIDEIDGLVRARDASGHNEDSKVVSEFLARLAQEDTNYLIIAATNRPDQLDSAILRPGRFDEQFEIGVPDARGREEIFKVQLRGRRPSLSDSDFKVLGERTDGYTAADIASVVERAALNAAERDAANITLDDLTSHLY